VIVEQAKNPQGLQSRLKKKKKVGILQSIMEIRFAVARGLYSVLKKAFL